MAALAGVCPSDTGNELMAGDLFLSVNAPFVKPNLSPTETAWKYLNDLQQGVSIIDLSSQVTGVLGTINGGTGHNNLIFTTTGATTITLPTSGTMLTSANAVTALTGTANQITASASVGPVTLSLPSLVGLTWLNTAGQKRVSLQFDKTDTTLATVNGLSVTTVGGRSYAFQAILYVTADGTGGQKYAIAGTTTAAAIRYDTIVTDFTGLALVKASRATALATSVALAGNTNTVFQTVISGTITVANAGTLVVQFAENSASGTSSVLVGSTFIVEDIA